MEKVVRLGKINTYHGMSDVFAKIEVGPVQGGEHDGKKRLSITGVEGPRKGGHAAGSCGQIEGHLGDGADIHPATGWDRAKIARFLDIWRRWHLNDMRAACEHQRDAWDPCEKVEVVTWKLTGKVLVMQHAVKRWAESQWLKNGKVEVVGDDLALARLPYELKSAPHEDLAKYYEVSKRETKSTGWVYPTEHPSGLLNKPCEVCGYKYGSQWLHEELPASIIEELAAFPDTDIHPAWV
jgi:hypothetical protein